MTHQYRAEDFADLPKKALEALGVTLKDVSFPVNDSMFDLTEVRAKGIGKFTATPTNAAALIVGLVQQRCRKIDIAYWTAGSFWNAIVWVWTDRENELSVGPFDAHGPTPLSAVLSAYAAALEGKEGTTPCT